MKAGKIMKWMLAICLFWMGNPVVMAQKSIDKLVEELEKRDDVSINSVTRRDPNARKVVKVVKKFILTDTKMVKRCIDAFEKEEEYAVTAVKDMPKGRRDGGNARFTFTFIVNKTKRVYTLWTENSGKISLTIIINPEKEGGETSWMGVEDELKKDALGCKIGLQMAEFDKQMAEFDKQMAEFDRQIAEMNKLDKADVILKGSSVYVNGKKTKKGTYSVNGRKVIVQ